MTTTTGPSSGAATGRRGRAVLVARGRKRCNATAVRPTRGSAAYDPGTRGYIKRVLSAFRTVRRLTRRPADDFPTAPRFYGYGGRDVTVSARRYRTYVSGGGPARPRTVAFFHSALVPRYTSFVEISVFRAAADTRRPSA